MIICIDKPARFKNDIFTHWDTGTNQAETVTCEGACTYPKCDYGLFDSLSDKFPTPEHDEEFNEYLVKMCGQ